MKKIIILFSIVFGLHAMGRSQITLTCGQNFYDDGGVAGDYSSVGSTGLTYVICADLPTNAVELVFSSIITEPAYDLLTIYDNNTATGTILDTISGTEGSLLFLAENATGCLTVKFTTDGSTIFPGWEAVVNCVPKPTCFKPTQLDLQSTNHVSATVGWTASASAETQWNVEYGLEGFTPGTGTEVLTTTNPLLIEGLNDATSYDVYVKANCGGTNLSISEGPLTFQTAANPFPAFICGNLFTDNGGTGTDYYPNTNDTNIICPTTPGQQVSLSFTVFDTEEDYDSLILYNGNSTLAPFIGSYDGVVSIGTITSTSLDGCITAVFSSDSESQSTGWSASITCIGAANVAPVANDDNGGTIFENGANGTVLILTNDTDPNGNPTVNSGHTIDMNTTLAGIQTSFTGANSSVWTYNTTTGEVTCDPAVDFDGTTTLTYRLCDGGGLCDNAIVTFIVQDVPLNSPPVANDDNGGTILENGVNGSVNILTNDTDLNGNPSPTSSHTVDLDVVVAGLQTTFTGTDLTVWTYNNTTGVLSCDPALDFDGVTTLTYQICDATSSCDDGIVTFTVQNTTLTAAPVANDDNGGTILENSSDGFVNILTNDTDADGNPSPSSVHTVDMNLALSGIQTTVTSPIDQSVWTYNATTGEVSCNPALDFDGVTSMIYELCDDGGLQCDNGTITFTVQNTTGILENTFKTQVYPNPVNNVLNVKTEESIKSVKIVNVDGKEVLTTKSSNTINVEFLTKGVYFLELTFENGITSRNQFVKN